jgi:ABC-2 type transport system permease protein
MVVLTSLAICWLSAALGMRADSVETASNSPMVLTLLVFLSSAFVPPAAMPGPPAWFAEHQPFTPITETLRGLLLVTPMGDSPLVAVAWCLVISAAGYLWSLRLCERLPARAVAQRRRDRGARRRRTNGSSRGPRSGHRPAGSGHRQFRYAHP